MLVNYLSHLYSLYSMTSSMTSATFTPLPSSFPPHPSPHTHAYCVQQLAPDKTLFNQKGFFFSLCVSLRNRKKKSLATPTIWRYDKIKQVLTIYDPLQTETELMTFVICAGLAQLVHTTVSASKSLDRQA